MTERDIIKSLMSEAKISQTDLQMALNLRSQSSITNYLKGGSMKVSTFVKILSVMDCELYVKSTKNEKEWKVGLD